MHWTEDRILNQTRPIITDGGMGTELEKSGVPMSNKIWSGEAVLSHPELVRIAHENFIRSGAETITTNTFSTARHMLEPAGKGRYVVEINRKAVQLAKEARDKVAEKPVAIVGSICEWAHNSEEKWNTPEIVGAAALEQAEILIESGVEIIALEMCERLEFSQAVVESVLLTNVPIWIGVSARKFEDHKELSAFSYVDRKFENLVQGLSGYSPVLFNIMHTGVDDVREAIRIIKKYCSSPIGVYPESGYFEMPNWNFIDIIKPEKLITYAHEWVDLGAKLLGGCCGISCDHIKQLSDEFHE